METGKLVFDAPHFSPDKEEFTAGDQVVVRVCLEKPIDSGVGATLRCAAFRPESRRFTIRAGALRPDAELRFEVGDLPGSHPVELTDPVGAVELSRYRKSKLVRIKAASIPLIGFDDPPFEPNLPSFEPGGELLVRVRLSEALPRGGEPEPMAAADVLSEAFEPSTATVRVRAGESRGSVRVRLREALEDDQYEVGFGDAFQDANLDTDRSRAAVRVKNVTRGPGGVAGPPLTPGERERGVRAILFERPNLHAYAVLDGASVKGLVKRLGAHKGEQCCLFSGDLPPDVVAAAPHLVRLTADDDLSGWLLTEGWGRHWGVYALVHESVNFKAVRKHFRTFLMVRKWDGQSVYFRYYDPRTLRLYLPTCTASEAEHVLGPLRAYVVESDNPDVALRFTLGIESARVERLELAVLARR